MKLRILALIMALLFVLPVISACADPGDDGENTTDVTTDVGATGDTVTTDSPFVEDDLGTMNFGKKVNVLHWDAERTEFFVEGDVISGDRVDDAIIARNNAVEERLGVELVWTETSGNYENQKKFITACQNTLTDSSQDIFAGYSMTAATLAINGYSQDLMEHTEYLNFSKPWWPESLIGQATINDKLYFASGDISTQMLHFMNVVFFNKDMLVDLQLEDDPYDLVAANRWTIRKMMSMCQTAYQDTGSTPGAKDIDDVYGFVSDDINYDSLYIGCGLKTIESGEDGLYVSPDFGSDTAIELVDLCINFLNEQFALGPDTVPADTSFVKIFAEGRALFTADRAYITTSNTMKEYGETLKYGVVPNPKWNAQQENYVTMLAFPFTMYQISVAAANPDAAAAVLECLGSEGYRKVTPELFETVMKVKYTSDPVAAQMYDLIKSCVYIDIGRIFSTELGHHTYKLFRNRLKTQKTNNYSSQYDVALDDLVKSNGQGKLDKINEVFFGTAS